MAELNGEWGTLARAITLEIGQLEVRLGDRISEVRENLAVTSQKVESIQETLRRLPCDRRGIEIARARELNRWAIGIGAFLLIAVPILIDLILKRVSP